MKNLKQNVPSVVWEAWEKLIDADFQAYLVGGCVRDLLLSRKPKDWDIATNAKPEEIIKIFGNNNAFYENVFGTVGVKTGLADPALAVIEVTTFRTEGKYSDLRHPDEVKFANTLETDLKRRDFTINALALKLKTPARGEVAFGEPRLQRARQRRQNSKVKIASQNLKLDDFEIIDLFGGVSDLKNRLIRTVGKPEDRFREDALRLMRAVRLAVELDFEIETATFKAIQALAQLIQYIARERVRDELIKILMQSQAVRGLELLRTGNLLLEIIPELLQGYQVAQNKHHKYDVYTHLLYSLDYAAKKNYSLEIRLAALLHDIAKPLTKQGEYPSATFYNHEIIGTRLVKNILMRLKFSNKVVQKVAHLVRHHMFYLEIDKVTPAAVRRFVRRAGQENLDDLFKLREADRIGSGVPKAVPYRLRYLKYLIKKVSLKPITPQMLKIDGNEVMEILAIEPGPKVGWVLKALLEEVLDEPSKNKNDYLRKRVTELSQLEEEELKKLALVAEEKKKGIEEGVDKKIKEEYRVS